jgi:hypothetical protein
MRLAQPGVRRTYNCIGKLRNQRWTHSKEPPDGAKNIQQNENRCNAVPDAEAFRTCLDAKSAIGPECQRNSFLS